MTIDPSGKFAYASHFSLGSFEGYRVNAKNGKLSSITGSTVTTTDPGPLGGAWNLQMSLHTTYLP